MGKAPAEEDRIRCSACGMWNDPKTRPSGGEFQHITLEATENDWSDDLTDTTYWLPGNCSISESTDVTGPNGLTVYKLVENTSNDYHTLIGYFTGATENTDQLCTFYVRHCERTSCYLSVYDKASSYAYKTCNLLPQKTDYSGIGSDLNIAVEDVGGYWSKNTVRFNSSSGWLRRNLYSGLLIPAETLHMRVMGVQESTCAAQGGKPIPFHSSTASTTVTGRKGAPSAVHRRGEAVHPSVT